MLIYKFLLCGFAGAVFARARRLEGSKKAKLGDRLQKPRVKTELNLPDQFGTLIPKNLILQIIQQEEFLEKQQLAGPRTLTVEYGLSMDSIPKLRELNRSLSGNLYNDVTRIILKTKRLTPSTSEHGTTLFLPGETMTIQEMSASIEGSGKDQHWIYNFEHIPPDPLQVFRVLPPFRVGSFKNVDGATLLFQNLGISLTFGFDDRLREIFSTIRSAQHEQVVQGVVLLMENLLMRRKLIFRWVTNFLTYHEQYGRPPLWFQGQPGFPHIQFTKGWERYDTEDGKPYYYHRPTGVTQWEKPI